MTTRRFDDPARARRRVVAIRFEVDDVNEERGPTGHERLARAMEAQALFGARALGAVVRDRRLFVDRGGEMREIATMEPTP